MQRCLMQRLGHETGEATVGNKARSKYYLRAGRKKKGKFIFIKKKNRVVKEMLKASI